MKVRRVDIHFVAPQHGYHEPDDFNPIYCGTEAEMPKATDSWDAVTCGRCLAIHRERLESRENHGPCMFRALAEDLQRQLNEALRREKDGTCDFHTPSCHSYANMLSREIEDICHEVSKVYCHITNGRISKANTWAEDVIAVHDDCCSEED